VPDPPLCPTCDQPASEALAGPEHGFECRNEACSEFGQAIAPRNRLPPKTVAPGDAARTGPPPWTSLHRQGAGTPHPLDEHDAAALEATAVGARQHAKARPTCSNHAKAEAKRQCHVETALITSWSASAP
jgi:hypothetical protein